MRAELMRAGRPLVALALAAAALAPGVAGAHDGAVGDDRGHGHHDHPVAEHHGDRHAARLVRRATQAYRDVEVAEADGYGQFLTCVREPGVGAMGTHWVNGDLVGDTVLDPQRPEAVMYETKRNGRLRLVGVEYIVFQDAWDAEHEHPPTLFGRPFHLTTSPNRYGLPPFYALHLWAWKHNPAGTFANWNARVTCDHAAGDPI